MKILFIHIIFPVVFFLSGFAIHSHAQIITTFAGSGSSTFSGDGGPATAAGMHFPSDITFDHAGNVLFVDAGGSGHVRKIDATRTITTIAGIGAPGFSGDGGLATAAQFNVPFDIGIDSLDNIYVFDLGNDRVRKINAAGIINTVAGNGFGGYTGDGGQATGAAISANGMAVDGAGNIYLGGAGPSCACYIRKVNAVTGIITTIAGAAPGGYGGDGGPATAALFNSIRGVELDRIGNIYVVEQGATSSRIRKIDTFGIVTTVAGTGIAGFSGDGGAATAAKINNPEGVWADIAGNLFIADRSNSRIRKVNTFGYITTVAGIGTPSFSGDGGPATAAEFNYTRNVARYKDGNIYIADRSNERVRVINMPVISIASSHADTLCAGTPVTFRATVINDTSIRKYQWKVNSLSVSTDTAVYVTDTLHNGDTITCTLTYIFGDTVKTVSNKIIVTVDSPANAGTITGKDTVCLSHNITLTDAATGGVWSALGGKVTVAAGIVTGITVGRDTICYIVTNACGSDTATHIVTIQDCSVGTGSPIQYPGLFVAPNPNAGIFTLLLLSSANDDMHIVITNLTGEKVKEITAKTNSQLEIKLNTPPGIYFISASTHDQAYNTKIMIGDR